MPTPLSLRCCISLLLLVTLLGCKVTAQSGPKPLNTKELSALAEVQSLMTLQKFGEADLELQKLLKKHSDLPELHYLSGEISRYRYDYAAAITALEYGINLGTDESAMAWRMLGEVNTLAGRYPEALNSYERYLAIVNKTGRSAAIEQGQKLLEQARTVATLTAHPYPFTPEPLGDGVNTTDLEYFPSLSADGRRLIFTRRVDRRQEDFYQSELLDDGRWSKAIPLPGINTDLNEGAQTITADGHYLIFTGCGRTGGLGSCDLYYSERNGTRWSVATNMGAGVNTTASESQPSLSRDGKLLFFTSNRSGGLGKDDLYVTGKLPDGRWSTPVNLGPTVNTAENDRYPFWAADNRTLYFTSNGRPGMGGADLFKTVLDDRNQWETPLNLGYPINTPGEETNLFVALDGKTAYFSKGVKDDIDIYQFELPQPLRHAPATYVAGTVVDKETGEPLMAEVRLQPQDSTSGAVTVSQTDRRGTFLTVLPTGRDYGLTVTHPGYLFYSDRFELAGEHSVTEPYELRISLSKVSEAATLPEAEADGAIVLRNVFFETGSAALLGLSTEELDRLVDLLTDQAGVSVEIAGHTDNVGSDTANQQLSERRAAAVKLYLEQHGIDAARIQSIGYGESRPVAPNDTEAERARNRRTTFRLLF